MKSLLFLMITALMFAGCSKDEDKDEFYEKQITANELESGTGTYVMNKGSYTYYLVFKNTIHIKEINLQAFTLLIIP